MNYLGRIARWTREHPLYASICAAGAVPLTLTAYSAARTAENPQFLIPTATGAIASVLWLQAAGSAIVLSGIDDLQMLPETVVEHGETTRRNIEDYASKILAEIRLDGERTLAAINGLVD